MQINGSRIPVRCLGTLAVLAGCSLAGATFGAEVVTYPAPAGEKLSTDYEVWAEGKKVDVYTARVLDPPFAGKQWDFGGAYSFANFDLSGRVTLRITSPRSLRNTVVRPQSPAVMVKVEDEHTLLLTLDGPRKLSIEPDGKKGPLLLFANPVEKDPPKAKDADVIYYGPGIHKAGLITVRDKQTLYLAGGAVVHGAVAAQGTHIRICGRGILDGSDYEWRKGPHPCTIGIYGADVELSGITIRGSPHWTIVPRGSRRVTIRNVKLCNSRVQNDDGINPCNSQDVRITDCFIRSDDDCIALKGLYLKGENNNVEEIVVENSILWCDRARIFLLGHESRAEFMRRVTFRNLDILHFSMTPFLLEPGEDMRLEDIRVEDVRVYGEGQGELIRLKPVVNQYMKKKVPGFIRNVHFKNLQVHGKPGLYQVQLAGADAEHDVRKVTFENVSILGVPLVRDSPQVSVGPHVAEVQFSVSQEGRVAAPVADGKTLPEPRKPQEEPKQISVRFEIGRPDNALFYGVFQGFGVEWDPFYWNDNNRRRGTDDAGWKLITERLKTLRIPIVRMMFQLSWCQRDPDLKQWDWDNPQVKSALRYLDFCQANDIHVVLTDWGWSAGAGKGRLYDKPDDPRFAAGIAAYLRELIVQRKYTCIKYLVVGNEPDNELAKWHSHAAYVAMYRNVDTALRRENLRDRVQLTGPDMAGQWEFMRKSIDAMKDVLDVYDFHRYASWDETANHGLPGTWESLWSHLDLWRGEVLKRDTAGADKPLLVTEMGSAGGSTNEQPKIDTFDYGLHMADYGTTLLNTRIQAGIAWTAHDIYYFDGDQFMRWGMWRYADQKWSLRPWAQAYGLLIRHAPRGSTRAPVNGTPPNTPALSPCRCAALVRPGGGWNIFLINRADHEIAAEVALPETPKADFAVYRFDQKSLEQNSDRIDLPSIGPLPSAQRLQVALPPKSFVVLVEK